LNVPEREERSVGDFFACGAKTIQNNGFRAEFSNNFEDYFLRGFYFFSRVFSRISKSEKISEPVDHLYGNTAKTHIGTNIRASAIDIHSRVRARTDSPGFGRGVDMGVIGYEHLLRAAKG
jgi:hypothetical protein